VRIANVAGRLNLLGPEGRATDVEAASEGLFGHDPQAVFGHWDQFRTSSGPGPRRQRWMAAPPWIPRSCSR